MEGARGAASVSQYVVDYLRGSIASLLCLPATVLMQRGLRLNPNSPELWLAYLRVELECLGRVIDTRNALHLPVPSTDIAEDTSPDTGIAAEAVAAAGPCILQHRIRSTHIECICDFVCLELSFFLQQHQLQLLRS